MAAAQSAQAQSQLAAPASITVTRENNSRDEKLYVSWSEVSGASGYNLACAASPPSNTQPMTSWSWWHCGSVTAGSTTSFTVDKDKRGDPNQDLESLLHGRRARRDRQSRRRQPGSLSVDVHPARVPLVCYHLGIPRRRLHLDLVGRPNLRPRATKVYCATRENNVSSAYTLCADVSNATAVNGRYSATISSWTAGGTNYTIDDTKTYDISIRRRTPGASPTAS